MASASPPPAPPSVQPLVDALEGALLSYDETKSSFMSDLVLLLCVRQVAAVQPDVFTADSDARGTLMYILKSIRDDIAEQEGAVTEFLKSVSADTQKRVLDAVEADLKEPRQVGFPHFPGVALAECEVMQQELAKFVAPQTDVSDGHKQLVVETGLLILAGYIVLTNVGIAMAVKKHREGAADHVYVSARVGTIVPVGEPAHNAWDVRFETEPTPNATGQQTSISLSFEAHFKPGILKLIGLAQPGAVAAAAEAAAAALPQAVASAVSSEL